MRYCDMKFRGTEGEKEGIREREKGRRKFTSVYEEEEGEGEMKGIQQTTPHHTTPHQHITKLFKTTRNNTAHNSQMFLP